MLTDVDQIDRRLLSERADQLWAHYAKNLHSTMACIEGASDEESVAVAARGLAARILAAKLA